MWRRLVSTTWVCDCVLSGMLLGVRDWGREVHPASPTNNERAVAQLHWLACACVNCILKMATLRRSWEGSEYGYFDETLVGRVYLRLDELRSYDQYAN